MVELSISGDLVQPDDEDYGIGSILECLMAVGGNAKLLHINEGCLCRVQVV